MDEEETENHSKLSAARKCTDMYDDTNVTHDMLQEDLQDLTPTLSRGSFDSIPAVDDDLVDQIKDAFKKYKLKGDEEDDVSGDEFETRKN